MPFYTFSWMLWWTHCTSTLIFCHENSFSTMFISFLVMKIIWRYWVGCWSLKSFMSITTTPFSSYWWFHRSLHLTLFTTVVKELLSVVIFWDQSALLSNCYGGAIGEGVAFFVAILLCKNGKNWLTNSNLTLVW